MKLKPKIIILLASCLISISFILPFLLKFKSTLFSNSISDWSSFGGYFGLPVAIINLMIISYLTIIFNKYQRDIDKPVIVFKVNKMQRKWFARNIGRGIAINIKIADKDSFGKILAVKCYSLGASEELVIDWKRESGEWIAVYEDYFGKVYSAVCVNDETIFFDGDKIIEKYGNVVYTRLDETPTIS